MLRWIRDGGEVSEFEGVALVRLDLLNRGELDAGPMADAEAHVSGCPALPGSHSVPAYPDGTKAHEEASR